MKFFYESIKTKENQLLRGVINTPDDFDREKKYPTMVFFHGFGSDRNGTRGFRIQHSKHLTSRGFITIRFDFLGCGESEGSFYDMTVSRQLKEAELIHDFTKMKYFVDKDRLYWLGHSLGGVLASLLAYKLKPKAMVLLAPASDMNNKDYLKVMAKTLFEGEVSKSTDITNNKSYEDLLSKIEDADIGGMKIHKNFLIDFIFKDIYKSAKKYHGKVLIIRGDRDELVFKDSNIKLKNSFKNAVYEEIKGADHSFTNEDDRKLIFNKVYDFLLKNTSA